MKEKSKKIVLIVLALFLGSFFLCNNAFAYTEIYSENFDSYTSNSCISYENGSFGNWKTSQSNNCLSSVKYSSNPNSLACVSNQYTDIYYEDFSLISGFDISAVFSYDAYLVTNGQYELALYSGSSLFSNFAFSNYYNNPYT